MGCVAALKTLVDPVKSVIVEGIRRGLAEIYKP